MVGSLKTADSGVSLKEYYKMCIVDIQIPTEKTKEVPWWECEEVFLNEPILLLDDIRHSESEKRYYALGVTIDRRRLFVAFTIRSNKIRPISARDMSRKERRIYEESEIETDPEI